MKNLIAIAIIISTLTSCEKLGYEKMPDIPPNDSIDLNHDLTYDIVIRYSTVATTDIPPSHQSITGEIKPLDYNQVLYHTSKGHLFLRKNDTIKRSIEPNPEWSEYAASVIWINGDKDKWDKEWKIVSDLSKDFFLGIKINQTDSQKIGWLLLDLDKQTGNIHIRDVELINENSLIISN